MAGEWARKVRRSALQRLYGAALGLIGGGAAAALGESLVAQDVSGAAAHMQQVLICSALYASVIGAAVGATPGVRDRTLEKAIGGSAFGALFGLAGGLVGGAFGQEVYEVFSRQGLALVGRSFGWMLVGLMVGGSVGASTRSIRKGMLGAIGGLVGGYLGGGAFELADRIIAGERAARLSALVLTGGFIGAMTTLVEELVKVASLTVLNGRLEGVQLVLIQNEVLLGSLSRADIALRGYEGVSRDHARIVRDGGVFRLQVSEDSSGALVNGHPFTGTPLQSGDQIQLGRARLLFQIHRANSSPSSQQDRSGTDQGHLGPGGHPSVSRLELGNTEFVLRGNTVTIGSHPSNEVVLDAADAAPFHVELRARKAGWVAFDVSGLGGMRVNDRPTAENLLRDGFRLQIGARCLVFRQTKG